MMRVENSVPEALFVNIFAKLPVKSLVRFMCLSKSGYQAISDPQFFSLHLATNNLSFRLFVVGNGRFLQWGSVFDNFSSTHSLFRPVISDFYSILMLDFTDETFKEIKMPDCFYEDLAYFYRFDSLGEVKGKLSLVHFDVHSSAGFSLEMWMTEDSGWVRQFVVNVRQLHAPICLGMNDDVVLLLTSSNVGLGHILSCDLKTLELTDHGDEEQRSRAFTYTPSLALLGKEN
ncbi:hypothetical protein SLA2020_386250 [Shorea laevis]